MIKFTKKLDDEMTSALNNVVAQGYEGYEFADQCYRIAHAHLLKLKDFMQHYNFKDMAEEILFFKEIKPSIHAQLLYYIEIMHIHALKPVIYEKDTITNFYQSRISNVMNQMENYKSLYLYLRTKQTTEDHLHFIRNNNHAQMLPEDNIDADPCFSTPSSTKTAKLLAWEKTLHYLSARIENINNVQNLNANENKNIWTHSKVALIELAYALHSCETVNYGKVDVKQIIKAFESTFGIDLGNFYRVFQNIRIRQGNRTAFLDELKIKLEKRMDDTDLGQSVR